MALQNHILLWPVAVTVLGEPPRKAVSSVSKAFFSRWHLSLQVRGWEPLHPYCVDSNLFIGGKWPGLESCAIPFPRWRFLGLLPHHEPLEMSVPDLSVSIYPLVRQSACSWVEWHTKIALKTEKVFRSGGSPEVQKAKGQWDTRQGSLPKALIRSQTGRGRFQLRVKF